MRSFSAGWSSKPGANSDMSGSAKSTNRAVTRPSTRQMRKNRLEATRNASLRSPFSSSSVKTGTNAPWSAKSANSARTRFGHLEGDGEGRHGGGHAEVGGRHHLAGQPEQPRAARWRTRRRRCSSPAGARGGAARGRRCSRAGRYTAQSPRRSLGRGIAIYGQHPFTRKADPPGGARAAGEPPPHLPGQDLVPRLESAVGDGDAERADGEYRSLVSRIDKAVKSGALHRNNAARKKSRAARLRSQL